MIHRSRFIATFVLHFALGTAAVAAAQPDLVVEWVEPAATTVPLGGSLSYQFLVANVGDEGPAGVSSFDVATYLSPNAIFDKADMELTGGYSAWAYHLTVDWEREHGDQVTIPASVPPGAYHLIVEVDAKPGEPPNFFPGVVELDEDNNWCATEETILVTDTTTQPDLVVSSAVLHTLRIAAGDKVVFHFTVSNVGGEGPAGNSTFDVVAYLSIDPFLTADDEDRRVYYGAWQHHLDENWTHTVQHSALAPASVVAGHYYLIVVADAFPNQPPNFYPGVDEANENNNWRSSAAAMVPTANESWGRVKSSYR